MRLNFANQVTFLLQFLVVEFCSWRFWSADFSKSCISWNQLNLKIRQECSILPIRFSLDFFRNWVMVLTFTIESSVEILDSYFNKHFLLRYTPQASIWHTSGFDLRFWLPLLVWSWGSSTSTFGFDSSLGIIWNSCFKVFDIIGPRLWALVCASGNPVLFCWCH